MAFRTNKVPAIEERTVSGSSVSFNSAFALPLKACKTEFMFTQSGTGDPSPQNARPFVTISEITIDANTNTFTVDLNGNRAGGVIDLVNKIGTITWLIQKISDMQVAYYAPTSSYPLGFFIVRGTSLKKNGTLNVSSEIFKSVSGGWATNYRCFGNGANDYIYVIDSDYSSANDFKTNLGNYEFAYELATPIEIDLSSIPDLSSILGNNTFSTDTGTLEITFSDLQEKTASGSVASFNTSLAMPLASCKIAVNAWQEGSGDPSPSNVRPIHGFRELNVTANNVVYTIQLGQEVYGAEIDVVNGVAHCTHGYRVFDGSESWDEATISGYKYFSVRRSPMPSGVGFLSNLIKKAGVGSAYYTGYIGGTYFNVRFDDNTSLADYISFLSQTNLQVVYELAEPFDIQLTPTQIETLIGNNTIFADTGDTSVVYNDLDLAKRGSFREVFKLP